MSKSKVEPTSPRFPASVVSGAQLIQQKYGVPASVTLSQWAVESSFGRHTPPGSNNPFGIKAKAGEPYVTAWTSEYVNGKKIQVQAHFRQFDSYSDAFNARGLLLSSSPRYAEAMKHRNNPNKFVDALQKAGYATDPNYASTLKKVIGTNKLSQFDLGAGNKMPMGVAAQVAASSSKAVMTATPPSSMVPCFLPTPDHPVIRQETDDDRIYARWRKLLVEKGYMTNYLENPLLAEHTSDPGEVKVFNDLHEQARKEILGTRYTPPDSSERAAEGILGGIDFINQFDLSGKDQNRELGDPNEK